jgi:hypothetical protein
MKLIILLRKGDNKMEKKIKKKREKKKFVEPELVKHDEKLDEVTMMPNGSPNGGMPQ